MKRLPFLHAFAADTRAKLAWLETELAQLDLMLPEHRSLLQELDGRRVSAAGKLARLDLILAVGHPALLPHAFPLLHQLEYDTNLISVVYLPALQRQGDGERYVRGILLAAARAAGAHWLGDILVRLDGAHAAFVSLPHLPIIYAPPRHEHALVDLPGLYHELGHAVFAYYPALGMALREVVTAHFVERRRLAAEGSGDDFANGTAELQAAEAYWTHEHLAELFCDVFATALCGPAHLASFVDLGLRQRDPFSLTHAAHPPLAARVRACMRALAPVHQEEPLIGVISEAWSAHVSLHVNAAPYSLRCHNTLVDALAARAGAALREAMPGLSPFAEAMPAGDALFAVESSATLEMVLNQAATISVCHRGRYEEWEARALLHCRTIADTESARSATQLEREQSHVVAPQTAPRRWAWNAPPTEEPMVFRSS